jgi:hypothetical protein
MMGRATRAASTGPGVQWMKTPEGCQLCLS